MLFLKQKQNIISATTKELLLLVLLDIYLLYLITYTYLNMSRSQNQLFTPGTNI